MEKMQLWGSKQYDMLSQEASSTAQGKRKGATNPPEVPITSSMRNIKGKVGGKEARNKRPRFLRAGATAMGRMELQVGGTACEATGCTETDCSQILRGIPKPLSHLERPWGDMTKQRGSKSGHNYSLQELLIYTTSKLQGQV
jgi:hypothetical protein